MLHLDPEDYPIDKIHFSDAPDVSTIPGTKSKKLLRKQDSLESNAVKYPENIPIALDEGKGATVRDVDGNLFLDFFAGIGVANVGHSNPYVIEGVKKQAESLIQTLDFPTETRQELVDKLTEIAPGGLSGNSRVLFGGPTGSNAIEGSIKLAKHTTGGDGLIAFRGAFHGTTSGALSLTAKKTTKGSYTPLLPDVYHVRYPSPFHDGLDPADSRERALEEVRQVLGGEASGLANPAGVWVEPIQGEGGIVKPPDGFLSGLKEITDEHNVPLVVDEVQAGFGRTGKWWASEWDSVTPDAITAGKALGGVGLPLSAVIYHENHDTWEPGAHTGTFRGHLPAMKAGIRAIEYIDTHDILAHTRDLGEYIRKRLREAAEHCGILEDVRGEGLFIGAEFGDTEAKPASEIVLDIQTYCYKRGALVWTAGSKDNVIRLAPPLVMMKSQAEQGLDIIVDAIQSVSDKVDPTP